MEPKTPSAFFNPHVAEIIKLEQQYSKAIKEGKVFEIAKAIRIKIKQLKSELGVK
jgi:hypothetical protein